MMMTQDKTEQYETAFRRLRTAWLAGDPGGEMAALREEFPELRAELFAAMQRWSDIAIGERVVGDEMVANLTRMASESRERLAEHSREAIGAVAAVQREVRRTGFLPWLERAAGRDASAIERETGIPVRFLRAIGDRAPQLPGKAVEYVTDQLEAFVSASQAILTAAVSVEPGMVGAHRKGHGAASPISYEEFITKVIDDPKEREMWLGFAEDESERA
jgi:hypothetical protein